MYKEISLSREGAQKLNKGICELYFGDIEDNIKSLIPGEWIYLKNLKNKNKYLGYANPLVSNNNVCIHVFDSIEESINSETDYLFGLIEKAISKRNYFESYEANARLVYGDSDGIPGLIVDSYLNVVIVQINNAGIDRFREEIKNYFQKKYRDKKVYILDNPKYRERELLPQYETEQVNEDIKVNENGIDFLVSKENLQKIGYYYDHRENRLRLRQLIKKLKAKPQEGLDLFCYVGSWGLNMLKAGGEHITFVDQGDFSKDIEVNLKKNNFFERGSFVRNDVFAYLKTQIEAGNKYDIICSDPPAFCKSKKEAKRAYEGYLRLHKYILSLLNSNSIFVACSCTHYINFEDFEKNIKEAARISGRKLQLLDVGLQGFDHPTKSLFSKNSYLKYFAYLVE